MKAIKDNAIYLEKIVTQDDGDSDFAKVTDTTVNYIPNEIPLLDTTTNTQLESKEELFENNEVLLIDTSNNIIETKLGSVTTGIIDTTQTLDIFGDNSCIAAYTFDKQNVDDLSGNYNGTWGGTEQYDIGKFGQAAKFDGSNYIKIPSPSKNLPISISLWFKTNQKAHGSAGWHNPTLIGFSTSGGGSNDFGIEIKDGYIGTFLGFGVEDYYYSDVYVADDEWHNVVLTVQPKLATLYLDGNKIFERNVNSNIIANVEYWYIGVMYDYGSHRIMNDSYYKGSIDQVRPFNKALSEEEVSKLCNEQARKYIADISSANLSKAPKKAFKKQLPSVSIAIEATETDITDVSFNKLIPKTTTYDGSKFTTVYSDLAKEGRVIQRKIVAPNKGLEIVEPFTSNLWKKRIMK